MGFIKKLFGIKENSEDHQWSHMPTNESDLGNKFYNDIPPVREDFFEKKRIEDFRSQILHKPKHKVRKKKSKTFVYFLFFILFTLTFLGMGYVALDLMGNDLSVFDRNILTGAAIFTPHVESEEYSYLVDILVNDTYKFHINAGREISGLKLDGRIARDLLIGGEARVFLTDDVSGETYIVFDSETLKKEPESFSNEITGNVILNETRNISYNELYDLGLIDGFNVIDRNGEILNYTLIEGNFYGLEIGDLNVLELKANDSELIGWMAYQEYPARGFIEPDNISFEKIFGFDLNGLNIPNESSVLLEGISDYDYLYKCDYWDFEVGICLTDWIYLLDIVNNESYSMNFSRDIIAFAEGIIEEEVVIENITEENVEEEIEENVEENITEEIDLFIKLAELRGFNNISRFNGECGKACNIKDEIGKKYTIKVYSKDAILEITNLSIITLENIEEFTVSIIDNETNDLVSYKKTDDFFEEEIETITRKLSNYTEEISNYAVVINRPVKWKKKVIFNETSNALDIELPIEASNISIKFVDDVITLEENQTNTSENLLDKTNNSLEEIINDKITGNHITGYSVVNKDEIIVEDGINVISVVDTDSKQISFEVEEEIEEIEVEYETPGPITYEEDTDWGKRIVVSSDIHYENILAYTLLDDIPKESIDLYLMVEGVREPAEIINYVDVDGNSRIDEIYWVVPSLSNQTYEIELDILNVKSYPLVGGNWTVEFSTIGVGDLRIVASNGTTWSAESDNESDLEFIGVKCGNVTVAYDWQDGGVEVDNYYCDEIGTETSKVLSAGPHIIQFNFGDDVDYAYNSATNITTCTTISSPGEYHLINDITSSTTTNCIDITGNNVIFDCLGNTINSAGAADQGIRILRGAQQTTNVTVRNCTLTDWDTYGILLQRANGNVFENVIIDSSKDRAMYSLYSDNNQYINVTMNASGTDGLRLVNSDKSIFSDCVFEDNDDYDFNILGTSHCNHELNNVVGTDGKPIIFYNSTVNLEHWDSNFSVLILCEAHNSVLNNITYNSGSVANNGIVINDVDNGLFENLTINASNVGLFVYGGSTNNDFNDITISNGLDSWEDYGLWLYSANYNRVRNLTIEDVFYGIRVGYSDHNNVSSSSITGGGRGFWLSLTEGNIFNDSIVKGTSEAGVYVDRSGENSKPALIYNNFFNNTANFVFVNTIYLNYWNTANQTGSRIYSDGTNIGGNYYANPSGTGYSETCNDTGNDGFCDEPLNYSTNFDYLPLSSQYVGGNNAPTNPTPLLNSTDGSNRTSKDLNCFDQLLDPDADKMNVTVNWYKNGVLNLTFEDNSSYVNGTNFNAILGNGNTSVSQVWECGLQIHDAGILSSDWVNSSNLTILTEGVFGDGGGIPGITLNTPIDEEKFNVTGNIIVNATITDSVGDTTIVRIFASNGTVGDTIELDDLIYYNSSVVTGTEVLHNFTKPLLEVDSDSLLLYHFDKRASYDENDTNVYDFSGNNFNGTILLSDDVDLLPNSNKVLAGSVAFGPGGGKVAVNGCNYACYNLTNRTYLFWLVDSSSSGLKTIASAFNLGTSKGFAIARKGASTPGNITIYSDSLTPSITAADFFIQGEIVHLGVVMLGNGSVYIYKNGVEFTKGTIPAPTDVTGLGKYFELGVLGASNKWLGAMDEVGIYNRAFTPEEIMGAYNWKNGTYYWKVNATNTDGNSTIESAQRTFLLGDSVAAPNDPVVSINSTLGTNLTTENLNCFATITDPDANKMNVTVNWYKNNVLDLTLEYNNSYVNGTLFTDAFLEDANTTVGDDWNCSMRLNDGSFSSSWVNSVELRIVENVKPVLTWETPTPGSGGKVDSNSVYLNTTVTDASNTSAFFDWNYTLLGYWSFDEYNASGIHDNSTYDHFAEFKFGASTSSIINGKYGKGIKFDGISNHVLTNLNNYSDELSFDYWFKSVESTLVGDHGFRSNVTNEPRIMLRHNRNNTGPATGYYNVIILGDSGNVLDGEVNIGSELYDGEWHHVVVNFKQSTNLIEIYFDKVKKTVTYLNQETPSITTGDNYEFAWGAIYRPYLTYNSDKHFNGSIDEARIYKRILSSSEINASFNTVDRLFGNFTGLSEVAYDYSIWMIDGSGNLNNTSVRTVTVDLTNPSLAWETPTPNDGSSITSNSVYLNTTVTDTSNTSAFFDWNYTLIGYWSFDEYNASGIYDNSTYDNFITFNGGVGVGNINQGKYGKGITFDGEDDYLLMPLTSSLNENFFKSKNWTIEMWLNPTCEGDTDQDFFTGTTYDPRIRFQTAAKTITFSAYNTTGSHVDIMNKAAALTANEWGHLAITSDGTNYKMYVDAVEVASAAWTEINAGATNYRLGWSGWGGRRYNGSIDEFKIFNRTLSVSEINASFNNNMYKLYNNFTLSNDGFYNYSAWMIDEGGNINSTIVRGFTATLDGVAPTITLNNPLNTSKYNISSVTFNVSLSEVGSWCGVSIGANANVSMTANGSSTGFGYINDSISDGDYNFVVSCNDSSSNMASVIGNEFFVDTVNVDVNYAGNTDANITTKNSTDIFVNLTTSDLNDHYSFVDFDDDLLLWMRMDDINASGDALDSSSYGNDGEAVGHANQTDAGRFGEGFVFDGKDDYISIPHDGSLVPYEEITLSAWVNFGTTGNYQIVIMKNVDYEMDVRSNGLLRLGIYNSSGTRVAWDISAGLSTDTWQHILMTYNGSTISGYVNGVLKGTNSQVGPIRNTGSPLLIGEYSSDYWYNGTIDEVMVINRSLSQAEISALYNSSASNYYNNFTGLDDGDHTFTGYSVDKGGNKNNTLLRTVTIDTVIPGISYAANTDANDSTKSTDDIFVNLTTSDANDYYSFLDFDQSLVMWMPMDDVNASGDPLDISGNDKKAAAISNAALVTEGYFGKGFEFDGNGDYIDVVSSRVVPAEEYTASAWFKVKGGAGGVRQIFETAPEFIISASVGGGNTVSIAADRETSDEVFNSNFLPTIGNWYHIVSVYDNGNLSLYVDGVINGSSSSGSGNLRPNSGGFHVGSYRSADNRWFNGTIDDVLVFNRSLSSTEISALYNASANQYYNNFTGYGDGIYNFTGHVVDKGGNRNSTLLRTVTITLNNVPNSPIVAINTTDEDNSTYEDLNCYSNISDPDADKMNVTVNWYKNFALNLSEDYNSSYVNNTLFVGTLDKGNTSAGENWTCGIRLHDGTSASDWVNATQNITILGCNNPAGDGDWDITGTEVCKNMDITVDGEVNVKSGGYLMFDNVTFYMDLTANDQHYFDVEAGGELYVKGDSLFHELDDSHYWRTRNYGTATIINSTFDTNRAFFQARGDGLSTILNSSMHYVYNTGGVNTKLIIENSYVYRFYLYIPAGETVNIDGLDQDDTDIDYNITSEDSSYCVNMTGVDMTTSSGFYLNNNGGDLNINNSNIYYLYHYDDVNDHTVVENSYIDWPLIYYYGATKLFTGIDDPYIKDNAHNLTGNFGPDNKDNDLNFTNVGIGHFNIHVASSGSNNITVKDCPNFGRIYAETRSEVYVENSTLYAFQGSGLNANATLTDVNVTTYALFYDSNSYTEMSNVRFKSSQYSNLYDSAILNFTKPYSTIEDLNLYTGGAETPTIWGFVEIVPPIDAWNDGNTLNRYFPFNVTNSLGVPQSGKNVTIKNGTVFLNSGITGADGLVWLNISVDNVARYYNYTVYLDDVLQRNLSMLDSTAPDGIEFEVPNGAPSSPELSINSTDYSNTTLQDLNCFATIMDPDAHKMNVTIRWYKDGVLNLTLEYNQSYANNTDFVATLESENTSKTEDWNCSMRLHDGIQSNSWVISEELTILNSVPSTPELLLPIDGMINISVRPKFVWSPGTLYSTTSSDPDLDQVTYNLNLTCFAVSGGGCADNKQISVVENLTNCDSNDNGDIDAGDNCTYMLGWDEKLKFYYDDNYFYNWTVSATDGSLESEQPSRRAYNLSISIIITFPTSQEGANFGTMSPGENSDTSLCTIGVVTSPPCPPIHMRNEGNVNISLNITGVDGYSFWETENITENPDYFSIKIGQGLNSPQPSYTVGLTNTTYVGLPGKGISRSLVGKWRWKEGVGSHGDDLRLDVNLTVPGSESIGDKGMTLNLTGWYIYGA
jgi:hypothetical protein